MDALETELTPERLADPRMDISANLELEFLRKDGTKFWADVTITLIRDTEGGPEYLLGAGKDATGRKDAENLLVQLTNNLQQIVDKRTEELRTAHESLLRQERLAVLGQLAASVSHELRNPLSVINNIAYYLKMKHPDLDGKSLRMLDVLEKEVERSDRIIGNMLGFSRHRPNVNAEMSLNDLVREYFQPADRVPGNILVDLKLDDSLKPILADGDKLSQVLDNLVTNACHAMPHGGTLTVETAPTADGRALLRVADTGHGMSREIMARIFEPLFSTKTTGFGLGLVVVKTLVSDHGGEVVVESEEGKGSAFSILLPLHGGKASTEPDAGGA
jgi:signal transduction histidine kinase